MTWNSRCLLWLVYPSLSSVFNLLLDMLTTELGAGCAHAEWGQRGKLKWRILQWGSHGLSSAEVGLPMAYAFRVGNSKATNRNHAEQCIAMHCAGHAKHVMICNCKLQPMWIKSLWNRFTSWLCGKRSALPGYAPHVVERRLADYKWSSYVIRLPGIKQWHHDLKQRRQFALLICMCTTFDYPFASYA